MTDVAAGAGIGRPTCPQVCARRCEPDRGDGNLIRLFRLAALNWPESLKAPGGGPPNRVSNACSNHGPIAATTERSPMD